MAQTLQHAIFLVAVAATAAAMWYAGPESELAIGTAFAGLVLVHLGGVWAGARGRAAAAGVGRSTPEAETSRSRAPKTSSPVAAAPRTHVPEASPRGPEPPERAPAVAATSAGSSGSVAPDPTPTAAARAPDPDAVPERPASSVASPRNGDAGPRGGPDAVPGRAGPPPSGDETAGRRASSRERDRGSDMEWLDGQIASDVEEVSFLPPYASGAEAEAAAAEDDDDLESWAPPEILEAVQAAPGEEAAEAVEAYRNVPIPRHFALGTVAIIRDLMKPAEVAEVLLEQRRQPKRKFGETAVSMGFLTEGQLEELLLAQQEGLFTDEEIQEARRRLRAYRHSGVASGG